MVNDKEIGKYLKAGDAYKRLETIYKHEKQTELQKEHELETQKLLTHELNKTL